jgi:hypothetical protein
MARAHLPWLVGDGLRICGSQGRRLVAFDAQKK